jgi:hypothetical protein
MSEGAIVLIILTVFQLVLALAVLYICEVRGEK